MVVEVIGMMDHKIEGEEEVMTNLRLKCYLCPKYDHYASEC